MKMEDKLSFDEFVGVERRPSLPKFLDLLEVSAVALAKLETEEKLKIVRRMIKEPNFDDVDAYYLGLYDTNPIVDAYPVPADDERERLPRKMSFRKHPSLPFTLCVPKGKRSTRRVIDNSFTSPVADEDDNASKVEALPITEIPSSSSEPAVSNPFEQESMVKEKKLIERITDEYVMVKKIETVRPKRLSSSDNDYDGYGVVKKGSSRPKKRIKKKEEVTSAALPEPIPELPAKFRDKIEELKGSDVVFLIQKSLYKTDVNKVQGRLSLPLSKIKNREFLTEEEMKVLNSRNGSGKRVSDIKALLIEPCCKRETMVSLRKWDMEKESGHVSSIYNLVTNWNSVVSSSSLCVGMTVQLWAFRVDSKLCFALVKVGNGDEDEQQ